MSDNTIIDVEHEVGETTLEDRVEQLEKLTKGLLQSQKNTLSQFREMIAAVKQLTEESSGD